MAFSVQNDLGTVTDANAYITVAEFHAYWTDRNVDTSAMTDPVVQGRIVEATQYIDMPVEAVFDHVSEDTTLVKFKPAS